MSEEEVCKKCGKKIPGGDVVFWCFGCGKPHCAECAGGNIQ